MNLPRFDSVHSRDNVSLEVVGSGFETANELLGLVRRPEEIWKPWNVPSIWNIQDSLYECGARWRRAKLIARLIPSFPIFYPKILEQVRYQFAFNLFIFRTPLPFFLSLYCDFLCTYEWRTKNSPCWVVFVFFWCWMSIVGIRVSFECTGCVSTHEDFFPPLASFLCKKVFFFPVDFEVVSHLLALDHRQVGWVKLIFILIARWLGKGVSLLIDRSRDLFLAVYLVFLAECNKLWVASHHSGHMPSLHYVDGEELFCSKSYCSCSFIWCCVLYWNIDSFVPVA